MPFVDISMRKGKPATYREAIFNALYQSLRDALNVPEDDQFMTITEHDASTFRHGSAFGIQRSDDTIYIQITVFNTRTVEQKKALYEKITTLLEASPGIRPEDVFILVYDLPKENWSVGNGIAQFV